MAIWKFSEVSWWMDKRKASSESSTGRYMRRSDRHMLRLAVEAMLTKQSGSAEKSRCEGTIFCYCEKKRVRERYGLGLR